MECDSFAINVEKGGVGMSLGVCLGWWLMGFTIAWSWGTYG